jgi:hypothetical protein
MVSAATAQKDQIKLQCVSAKADQLGTIATAAETAPEAEVARMADDANRIATEAGECVGANGKKASEDVQGDEKAGDKGSRTAAADKAGSIAPESFTSQVGANTPGNASVTGGTVAGGGEAGVSVTVPPATSSAK